MGSLSNVISGIMIRLDQPFQVGDRIEIQGLGTCGDVVDIELCFIRIRSRDNRQVIISQNSNTTDQFVYPKTGVPENTGFLKMFAIKFYLLMRKFMKIYNDRFGF